jgi:hypothetical protein
MSKPVGIDLSRMTRTEINPVDIGRIGLGHPLQARSGMTNVFMSWWNRLSDNAVAEMLADPVSLRILSQAGSMPKGEASNALLMTLIANQGIQNPEE